MRHVHENIFGKDIWKKKFKVNLWQMGALFWDKKFGWNGNSKVGERERENMASCWIFRSGANQTSQCWWWSRIYWTYRFLGNMFCDCRWCHQTRRASSMRLSRQRGSLLRSLSMKENSTDSSRFLLWNMPFFDALHEQLVSVRCLRNRFVAAMYQTREIEFRCLRSSFVAAGWVLLVTNKST